MRISNYLVEDVGTQEVLGNVKLIAAYRGVNESDCFEQLYKLNKDGHINFINKKGKYIVGIRLCVDSTEKNISVYRFNVFLENREDNSKNMFCKLLQIYYTQPFYILTFMLLSLIPITVYAFTNILLIVFINALIISSLLIHELGHYLSAHLLKVSTAFHVMGIKTSVLYRTDEPIKSIIISSFGFIANFICLILVLVIMNFNHDIYLKVLSLFCVILQIVFMLSIIPICQDGKNILEGIIKISRRTK